MKKRLKQREKNETSNPDQLNLADEASLKEYNFSRSVLDSLTVPFFMFDTANMNFFRWNKVFNIVTGYSDDEIARLRPADLIPEFEHSCLLNLWKEFKTTGHVTFEMPAISKKSTTKQYLFTGNLLHYDGKPYIVGMGIDITERKDMEKRLKKSEKKYRFLADHMKDFVWLMDLNLKWTYISPSIEKYFGYTLEDLHLLPLDRLLTKTSYQKAMELFSQEISKALKDPPPPSYKILMEFELRSKDDRTLCIENAVSLIQDENGKPLSLLGEGRDITERKQIEHALRESERNFRHSLDNSPLGVRISTSEGETIYANKAILDIYGYDSVEELRQASVKERYTPERYAQWLVRKKKRQRGEFVPSEYEISIIKKTGEIRHLHVFRKEIFWNGKKQAQVIYQDITEHKQAEEKLSATLENLRQSVKATIQVLSMASEIKDPYTAGHHKKVANLARTIAQEQCLSQDVIEGIRMAGSIHDIGKLSIPGEILSKPTKLSDIEFSIIKQHPQIGYDLLKDVESPWPLADIVHQHHERMDGSGYPNHLKGDEILVESRIMAVADVVEAMASHRPYRPALGIDLALQEIEKNKGILYDVDVVDTCLRLFREKGYQFS